MIKRGDDALFTVHKLLSLLFCTGLVNHRVSGYRNFKPHGTTDISEDQLHSSNPPFPLKTKVGEVRSSKG